jgi:hypothetical protein
MMGICRMRLSASAAQQGMLSFFTENLHQRGRECSQQEQPLVSGLDAVHLISRHDSDNAGVIGDICSRKRAAPTASEDIVDLHLPGMDMVADDTAGIDPYMVQAHAPPGIIAGHQVPEKDTRKLRVGIPRQGFCDDRLSGYDHRIVPAG